MNTNISDDFVNVKDEMERLFFIDCLTAGVPTECAGVLLSKIEPRNAEQKNLIDKLNALLEGKTWCVSVLGSVGNGKTTLTTALVNQFIRKYAGEGYRPHYETLSGLLDKIKRGYNTDDPYYQDYLYEMEGCELLVIDELSPSAWTPYAKETIQKIILQRHANKKLTVLIGNLNGEDMKKMFDEMILSRLRTGLQASMTASDMRTKGEF